MKIRFVEDAFHSGDSSEHNHLAAMCARYRNDVRYYDGTPDVAYGFAIDGFNTPSIDIKNACKKVCIRYDATVVSTGIKYDDIITFGPDCKYRTYPIDRTFIHKIKPIEQTLITGCGKDLHFLSKHIDSIEGNVIIAIPYKKSVARDVEKMLTDAGKQCSIATCVTRDMIDTYLMTSAHIIGINNGIYGSIHSTASYLAINNGIDYISDTEIVEPVSVQEFIEEEYSQWKAS